MIKFADLKLSPKVLKAVEAAGYESPTPIQAGAIPPALEGRDVLGIAQTGTGKTASFTLPMITMLSRGRARARMPRSLVLCPTRELAAQVAENFDNYAVGSKLTKALLIGGVSFKEQDKLIDRGVDVLIATPGRLIDHFERGKLMLTGVQIMVVDEADRMLDMGFIPDIERIFSLTPFTRQTLFFSATMAPEIERITNMFLSNPAKVEVARAATTNENITQGVVKFKSDNKRDEPREKRDLLRALIEREGDACTSAIVFCNRKVDVDTVAKSLKKHGYNAEPIHGDLEQSRRMEVLAGFRSGDIKILCASDVAARGLDIPNVSHIFNFDVPGHAEDYVHRIGRTGRAGKSGTALMICVPRDEKNLDDVERLVKQEIPRLDSPFASKTAPKDAPAPAVTKVEANVENTEKTAEEKPKRSRRSRKPKEAPKDTVEAAVVEKSESKPAPRVDAPRENQPREKQPHENQQREKQPRQNNNRRGGNNNGNGNRNQQKGMGDHMPDFIAKSFDDRRDS